MSAFRNEYAARQLIDFDGMRFGESGNVFPTDIDAFIEWRDYKRIFYEVKHARGHMPAGQRKALERTVDDITRAGKDAVCFLVSHHTPPEENIVLCDTTVSRVYYGGQWRHLTTPWNTLDITAHYLGEQPWSAL